MSDDLSTEALPRSGPPTGVARVTVRNGREAGTQLVLDTPALVGTSEICELRLSDRSVSRRHVLLSPHEIGVRVQDQESRNGTFYADARVFDAEVPFGSEIRVGGTILALDVDADAPQKERDGVERSGIGRFTGAAPVLQSMYHRIERAAGTDATILLEGESGTGKDVLAEAIHEHSARARHPFVVFDCGAVPEALIESELFGHVRGAFTGADRTRTGAFELAHGGTLFLDEIGELPLALQTRLLRAIDSRRIRPLGGQKVVDVDVRIVAATNRNLDLEVEQGRFRLDLFHRLSVVVLRVPPLRERTSDIPLLIEHFLAMHGRGEMLLSRELLARASAHRWPGNVRELRNYVERLAIFGEDAPVGVCRDGAPVGGATSIEEIARTPLPFRAARAAVLREFTRAYVASMLSRHGGNVSSAAREAGIARRYFQVLKSGGDPEPER